MKNIDALHKFQNQLLSTFDAQDITYLKRSGWDGMLENIDRLYATMLHDWDVLQKDTDSVEKAVRSLDWSLIPYVKKGEKVSAQAKKVAQVVEDALWRREPQQLGTFAHSFTQLLGALVHAEFRGQNVHRIVWRNDGNIVYPAAYVQLPPQFVRWETEPGKPDLLLHVPDGEVEKPVPFKPYQFIVALNNTGPDHPLYNATYYSLVPWFTAAKYGLGWFMQYAEQHHLPKPVLHYDNNEDRERIIADLQQERVINAILLEGDRTVEWANVQPGTTMPQKDLLELSEQRCHKAMLGQTLTSGTDKHGGSLAQAKVHAGVQADEVMKHAEFVADVINRQLIPAIVYLNFGKVEGMPLPELRCKLPQAVANIERAQFWTQVMQIPGIAVVKSDVYDSLGIAMPTEDDEVLEAPSHEQGAQGGVEAMLQGLGKGRGKDDTSKRDEVAVAARAGNVDGLTRALPAWLEPIKKKLIEARKAGATLEELREQMLEWHPNTQALAGAFAENVEAGLRGESADETVTAQCNVEEILPSSTEAVEAGNIWGCNDSVHKCPKMKGTSREPKIKNAPRLFRVNPDATVHEQINQLASAIEKASQDGARLEAVIKRPEFGELILECGNSSPTHPSRKEEKKHGAHGIKHALEERHGISPKDIAEAIIQGEIRQHEGVASRLKVTHNNILVILEREQKQGSGRISGLRAKLHTAMTHT